jgi:hypothetical protein
MLFRMKFCRFLGVMFRLEMMPMSNVRVTASRFVLALFMILGGFFMMFHGVFVMLRCFFVMFRSFVFCHLERSPLRSLKPHRARH